MVENKLTNRVQSGSFEHRCMAAGLSLTLGPTWAVDTWNHLFKTPSPIAEMYANQRKRKHEQDTSIRNLQACLAAGEIFSQQFPVRTIALKLLLQVQQVNQNFVIYVRSS